MYVGINMYIEKERKERKIGSSHGDREARQKTSNSNSFISPNIYSKLNAANINCHSIMTVKRYVYMSEGEAGLHSNSLPIFQRQGRTCRVDKGMVHLPMELIV